MRFVAAFSAPKGFFSSFTGLFRALGMFGTRVDTGDRANTGLYALHVLSTSFVRTVSELQHLTEQIRRSGSYFQA